MPQTNITDFNIRGNKHPKYNSKRVLEDRTIEFVIQKLENVLFTNKGDVLGDPNFGVSLEYYLWSTNIPVISIENKIKGQIDEYVPELNQIGYDLTTEIYEGTTRDILNININIKDVKVNFLFT